MLLLLFSLLFSRYRVAESVEAVAKTAQDALFGSSADKEGLLVAAATLLLKRVVYVVQEKRYIFWRVRAIAVRSSLPRRSAEYFSFSPFQLRDLKGLGAMEALFVRREALRQEVTIHRQRQAPLH